MRLVPSRCLGLVLGYDAYVLLLGDFFEFDKDCLKIMSETDQRFDVVTVGGGLVGAVGALCFDKFAGSQFRQALIERGSLEDFSDFEKNNEIKSSGRAYALSESSRAILDVLGLWDEMKDFAQPIQEVDISDSDLDSPFRPIFLNFSGEIALGKVGAYIIEHEPLAAPIYRALRAAPSLEIFEGSQLEAMKHHASYVELELDNGVSFLTSLCIGADGRGSKVRSLAEIKTITSDYEQDGIVVTVNLSRPHNGKAVQHFLPSGPFAILPLPGDKASLVWTERRGKAADMCALSDEDFISEVNLRFSPKLGTATLAGPRKHFPLSLVLARSFIGDRVVLVGDAAHGVHPLAGQGMNLGLRDVAALVEVIVETKRLGLDIGGNVALERYQQWRRFDGVMSALAMDGMKRLFSNDNDFLRELRGFGLRLVDRLPPLKEFFVKEAAGMNGDVPLLMQGKKL